MIIFRPLWETMLRKNVTAYMLSKQNGISCSTIHRLRKNMPVSTYTLLKLCKILDCRIEDIVEYVPDEET